MNQTIEEINNRDFDKCYFSIMVFSTKINYKMEGSDDYVVKHVYTFYGCNIHGIRKYIISTIKEKHEKVSDWYNFLMILKKRKIEVILYSLISKDDILEKALKLAFPEIEIIYSCSNIFNIISNYYSLSYSSKIFKMLKAIYLSSNIEEYNISLSEFKEMFKDSEFILDLLKNEFILAEKNYNHDYLIRKNVFSYYFCRDFRNSLNKISNSKAFFTNLEDFTTLLIPIISNNEKRMFCTKKEWCSVINKIYQKRKDLIKCYL